MRRLLLTLTLLSLAFAPAPWPKTHHRTPRERQVLGECARRLDELGVRWELLSDGSGRRAVSFGFKRHLKIGGLGGDVTVKGDDLPGALREVILRAESFFNREPTY
jgi:hypothetical protein